MLIWPNFGKKKFRVSFFNHLNAATLLNLRLRWDTRTIRVQLFYLTETFQYRALPSAVNDESDVVSGHRYCLQTNAPSFLLQWREIRLRSGHMNTIDVRDLVAHATCTASDCQHVASLCASPSASTIQYIALDAICGVARPDSGLLQNFKLQQLFHSRQCL